MFVGIGIGMLFGETGSGTMVGMGVGFIADSIYSKNKSGRSRCSITSIHITYLKFFFCKHLYGISFKS
jgi:hypothetical protein